jgi:hypothetical protein
VIVVFKKKNIKHYRYVKLIGGISYEDVSINEKNIEIVSGSTPTKILIENNYVFVLAI